MAFMHISNVIGHCSAWIQMYMLKMINKLLKARAHKTKQKKNTATTYITQHSQTTIAEWAIDREKNGVDNILPLKRRIQYRTARIRIRIFLKKTGSIDSPTKNPVENKQNAFIVNSFNTPHNYIRAECIWIHKRIASHRVLTHTHNIRAVAIQMPTRLKTVKCNAIKWIYQRHFYTAFIYFHWHIGNHWNCNCHSTILFGDWIMLSAATTTTTTTKYI